MHSHSIILSLSIAAAVHAQESGSSSSIQQQPRGGLGGTHNNYESVSAEPLTFEVAEPVEQDRERILAEGDILGEEFEWMEDYEVMEGMDLLEGEEVEDFTDALDDEEDEEEEGYDEVDSMEEGEDEFDSSFVSEDGVTFFSQDEETVDYDGDGDEDAEGYDEVGAPLAFNEPIARRLRRRVDDPVVGREEMEEERYLAEKESFRDDSIPIFEPTLDDNEEFDLSPYFEPDYQDQDELSVEVDGHERNLQSNCKWNQARAKIEIVTDRAGHETYWTLTRTNGAMIMKGPPGNSRYADLKRYLGAACLNPGSYRFTMFDRFRDGMCGPNTGRGRYAFYLKGVKRFTSPSNCSANWGKRVHTFTVRAPSQPTTTTNNNNNNNNAAIAGRGGCTNVKVQFKVDKYGRESTVTLTGNGATQLASRKDVGAYQIKTMQKCVPPGTYTLRLVDQDGICCKNGQGWYKMSVNGQNVITGGYFIGSKSHTIKIGSNWRAQMSARDTQWLNSHNARRRKYNGGRGYVALRWSRTLANDARNYAERLGNNCKGALVHAQNIQDGENLAKNSGSGSWGAQYTTEKVMGRWVENELNWAYPKNAHYTQVVWRATQYVGCGESVRNIGNNQQCRVQVCRYSRAGNCNVRNGNWRSEAWKDDTGCGRPCPGTCFA
ncbi:hypothetical protein ACHAXR_010937 [Thalassiosira sp. AJA248-18]